MSDIDNLENIFSLRIPSATKRMLDDLSTVEKAKLNEAVRNTIAKAIHDSKFDARLYLRESAE
jgi:hypothetical protein